MWEAIIRNLFRSEPKFKPTVISENGSTEMVLENAHTVYESAGKRLVELGYSGDGRLVSIRISGDVAYKK